MNQLIDNSITIYEAMKNIESGKYVMPAFQREYVWNIEQIEKLWDSILLNYPISNFLFWHIDDTNVTWDTYFCNFLKKVVFNSSKQSDNVNFPIVNIDLNYIDIAILDGQQRLTSLYLSLFGETYLRPRYLNKNTGVLNVYKVYIELDKNRYKNDDEDYNSKKYNIQFATKIINTSPTLFELRNILDESFQNDDTREKAIEDAITKVPDDSKEYARDVLINLYNKIFVEKLIRYTEIIGMSQDDALEMFIRFNNGGKKLRKHEITMSIFEVYWPNAKEQFSKLLSREYENFNADFIIRAALMLYGDVKKTIIDKKVADDLKNNWSDFKIAFKNMQKVFEMLHISVKHFEKYYTRLIPIIYHIYNNPDTYEQDIEIIRVYLIRTTFFMYFSFGSTTTKLHRLKINMDNNNMRLSIDMMDSMAELQITESRIEDILNSEKGSKLAYEVLYFIGREWIDEDVTCYEQDHIHPGSRFSESKPFFVSVYEWKEWYINRNRLPNLQLLDDVENKSKSNRSLIDYCNNMNDEQKRDFYKKALIPQDAPLEIEHFGEFYEKRKKILREKIIELLK